MGDRDFVKSDDPSNTKDYFQSIGPNPDDAVQLKAAQSSKQLIALGTAAFIALAAGTAQQFAQYSGTNYNGTGGCRSFNISSMADPLIGVAVADKGLAFGQNHKDIANFNTVYNTEGGATTLSTQVSKLGEDTYNTSSTLAHKGANAWSFTATAPATSGGPVGVVVNDATGSHVVTSDYHAPDGMFVYLTGNYAIVSQPLTGGGAVTTTYSVGGTGEGKPFINVTQNANGAAVISGTAIAYGAKNDSAYLTMPCTALGNQSPNAVYSPASLASPPASAAPAPAPPPAQNNFEAGAAF